VSSAIGEGRAELGWDLARAYYQRFDIRDPAALATSLAELYGGNKSNMTFEGAQVKGKSVKDKLAESLTLNRNLQREVAKLDSASCANGPRLRGGDRRADDDGHGSSAGLRTSNSKATHLPHPAEHYPKPRRFSLRLSQAGGLPVSSGKRHRCGCARTAAEWAGMRPSPPMS
jgi:hypothetical protein